MAKRVKVEWLFQYGRRHGIPAQRPLSARTRGVPPLLHLRFDRPADHRHLRRGQLRAGRTTDLRLQQRERGKRGGAGVIQLCYIDKTSGSSGCRRFLVCFGWKLCRYEAGNRYMALQPFLHVFCVVFGGNDRRVVADLREARAFVAYVNLCINYVMYRE